jgi:probable phosphoglycerate mutase
LLYLVGRKGFLINKAGYKINPHEIEELLEADPRVEEAVVLGRHMAGLRLDAIYTSPRQRARETAEIVAQASGVAWEMTEALDEIDFGAWSGMSFDALDGDPRWRRWNEERDSAATPAGDTMAQVCARAVSFIEGLYRRHPGEAFALVSHSDVIKAVLCHYLGLPFSSVHGFDIAPASRTTLLMEEAGAPMTRRNVRPALHGAAA